MHILELVSGVTLEKKGINKNFQEIGSLLLKILRQDLMIHRSEDKILAIDS